MTLKPFDVRTRVLDRLVDRAILAETANHVLRDIPRHDSRPHRAVQVDLDGVRNLEPAGLVTNPSAAIELLPMPVANAPNAPYIGVCESQPTTIMPGVTSPASMIT